jgi:hypothetical protein
MDRLLAKLEGRADASPLPMITSCCPGWINYVEHCAPEMIPYIRQGPVWIVGLVSSVCLHTASSGCQLALAEASTYL